MVPFRKSTPIAMSLLHGSGNLFRMAFSPLAARLTLAACGGASPKADLLRVALQGEYSAAARNLAHDHAVTGQRRSIQRPE